MGLLESMRHSSWFTVLAVLTSHCAWAYEVTGRVIGVHDGDTVTVLDQTKTQHKVRLAGIDAPELKQSYGNKSKQHLSDNVFGHDVRLDCSKREKYMREVCVIYVNGQDANLAQVKEGMAWWYRQFQREQSETQRTAYETAESVAMSQRMGLWHEADPVPPWEFRHQKKQGR